MNPERVISAIGALAQETRLAVFRMLVAHGSEGLPAGVISERLDLPPSSLTFHLQRLIEAGLIRQRRVSRQLIYSVDFARVNSVIGYLNENCCSSSADCDSDCQAPEAGSVGWPGRKSA
jgi:ArsR family transcriptional regulator